MEEIDLLASVLAKTAAVIDGVAPDRAHLPTPCPGYDVDAMVNHIVAWAHVFEAASQGRVYEGDVESYRCGNDPSGEFRAVAESMVAGWREHGLDRQVRLTGGDVPGEVAFNMTLMEYLTHGWDLAVGSGQPIPYTEEEARAVLERAEATLPPQYRGEGMPFGDIVSVSGDAPAIDRLIGFMGRHPR